MVLPVPSGSPSFWTENFSSEKPLYSSFFDSRITALGAINKSAAIF